MKIEKKRTIILLGDHQKYNNFLKKELKKKLMNGHQLFNIEKIKEATNPIESLQGNLSNLEYVFNSFKENKEFFDQNIIDRDFSLSIQSISEKLDKINENLIRISNENINKFLFFQDLLIKKYKESFKEDLKQRGFN